MANKDIPEAVAVAAFCFGVLVVTGGILAVVWAVVNFLR